MKAPDRDNNTVKLWDAVRGQELRTLAGHGGRVMAVAFSPDGHTLASASADGSVRLWSVVEGREICSWWFIAEGVWLILLPDGRFDASPRGLQYLAYTERDSYKSYTAEELRDVFYRPDEVREEVLRYVGPAKASG